MDGRQTACLGCCVDDYDLFADVVVLDVGVGYLPGLALGVSTVVGGFGKWLGFGSTEGQCVMIP